MPVKDGEFTTKSELIRFAIKQALFDEKWISKLNATTSKLQEHTKSKMEVDKEIEWAKASTRKTVTEMLKE